MKDYEYHIVLSRNIFVHIRYENQDLNGIQWSGLSEIRFQLCMNRSTQMAKVKSFGGKSGEIFNIQLFFFTEWHWLYIRFQGICPDVLFFSSIFIMISELCCQSICFCKTILPELTILTFDIGSILQFLWAFLSASCYDGQTRIFPIVSGSQCLASPIQEVPRCNLFVQFPSSRFEKDFSREIFAMSLDRCLERRRSSQVNKMRAKLPWSRKVEVSLLVLDKKLLEQLKKRGLKIEENTVAGHFREDWQLSWRRGGRCQAERSYSLP